MEADATASPKRAPAPEEASPEDPSPAFSSSPVASSSEAAAAPPGAREVAAAMQAVERDAAAIAESYASLFASLRVALSNVTSTSAENMQCLGTSSAASKNPRSKRLQKEINTSIPA